MRFQTGYQDLEERRSEGRDTRKHSLHLQHYKELYGVADDGSMLIVNGAVLLHGVPGTVKTISCQAVVSHIETQTVTHGVFLYVRMKQLTGMYFGQSAQKVAHLFQGVVGMQITRALLLSFFKRQKALPWGVIFPLQFHQLHSLHFLTWIIYVCLNWLIFRIVV